MKLSLRCRMPCFVQITCLSLSFWRFGLLFLFFSTLPLAAQEFRLAALPFYVSGSVRASGLPPAALPDRFSELSLYLLAKLREFRPLSVQGTRRAISASSYKISRPFSKENRRRFCRKSEAAYLLTGSVYLRKGQLGVELQSWSCRLGRNLGRAKAKGNVARLQSILRRALRRATPFLSPRQSRGPVLSPASYLPRPVDLAVILDTSGSMLRDTRPITKALGSLGQSLEDGSRLGLILFREGDRILLLPFSRNWETSLAYLPQYPPGGENSKAGLYEALSRVARFEGWQNERRLFLFTDVSLGGRRQSRLEILFRRIKARGVRSTIFPLLNQSWTDKNEWRRIARSLSMSMPAVRYGRKLTPFGKQSYYLLTVGNRYYKLAAYKKLEPILLSPGLPEDLMEPIGTAAYLPSTLTLERLSTAFPKRRGERIFEFGPILSNLEKVISASLTDRRGDENQFAKVLLKNGKQAFWIRLASRPLAEEMRRRRDFFLGAHFTHGKRGLEVLPEGMELRGFSEVPRLLVTSWERLQRSSKKSIHIEDTWFLQVRFLEMR